MSPDTALALEFAGLDTMAVLIVAMVVAGMSSGAYGGAGRAPAHDVERALGAITIVTYEQAADRWKNGNVPRAAPPTEGEEEEAGGEEECCTICLTEYAAGDNVCVVPACGHFFHAECGNRWFQKRRTCPLCRRGLWPLPECPPMGPRAGGVAVGVM